MVKQKFIVGKMKLRKIPFALLSVVLVVSALLQPSWAKKALNASNGVAIQGYDTVAYFTEKHEAKGEPEFMHKWKGALWLFKSAENRDMFAASPEKYALQYGGHCSLSVAYGKDFNGSGAAWYIHKGKLYLNYSKKVREKWLRNPDWNISRANDEWPRMVKFLE